MINNAASKMGRHGNDGKLGGKSVLSGFYGDTGRVIIKANNRFPQSNSLS